MTQQVSRDEIFPAMASSCFIFKSLINNDVRDITNKAVRQTIEENQDLKRQNILLEQQLDEKERRIKVLERLLLSEGKSFRNILDGERSSVNTASQVSYYHLI